MIAQHCAKLHYILDPQKRFTFAVLHREARIGHSDMIATDGDPGFDFLVKLHKAGFVKSDWLWVELRHFRVRKHE